MEKMEEEMQNVTQGKDVKFLNREDSEDQVNLSFELIGLTSEEIKISITSTNILEIELLNNNNETGPSCIWVYPLEQGLKVDEMSNNFVEDGHKLIVTLPKDPNFQEVEEEEESVNDENSMETSEETENQDWICPLSFWPFAMTPAIGDDTIPTVQPIKANVEESEDQFKIEMKIEGFKADEINVRLCQNRVLNVNGKRKKKSPENPENPDISENQENLEAEKKISRKSFGRIFWIPDGCNKEEITAKTRMEDAILILTITVPKGGESSSADNGKEAREISIQQN